ncbi:TRAP transporter small permease subunit [Arhodomonas aquaeolei]|uniref:TRAP transporter small permease subunit n=1 Tax=Arhodomonas aquaeolei TaxID=2369 RepID=UPI0003716DE2|nr:TRAP transporter small permease [Arhodomonas aquaeolei]
MTVEFEDTGEDPRESFDDAVGARTRLDRFINRGAKGVAWLVFAAMAISVYEVFMRYVLNAPTSWVHETTVFLVAITFALGGPVALARDRHIRVRLLYDAAGPRLRYVLDVFNDAVTLLFCLTMTYAAYVMFWRASHGPTGDWHLERSGTSWNPPFPALTKGIIMVAVGIMCLQAVLHLVQSLRGQRSGGQPAEGH